MLLNLLMLNVFIMLCSWVLVTYNRRAGLVDVAWSFSIALNVIIAAWAIDSAPCWFAYFWDWRVGSGFHG